jgi:hypothetical protein
MPSLLFFFVACIRIRIRNRIVVLKLFIWCKRSCNEWKGKVYVARVGKRKKEKYWHNICNKNERMIETTTLKSMVKQGLRSFKRKQIYCKYCTKNTVISKIWCGTIPSL